MELRVGGSLNVGGAGVGAEVGWQSRPTSSPPPPLPALDGKAPLRRKPLTHKPSPKLKRASKHARRHHPQHPHQSHARIAYPQPPPTTSHPSHPRTRPAHLNTRHERVQCWSGSAVQLLMSHPVALHTSRTLEPDGPGGRVGRGGAGVSAIVPQKQHRLPPNLAGGCLSMQGSMGGRRIRQARAARPLPLSKPHAQPHTVEAGYSHPR